MAPFRTGKALELTVRARQFGTEDVFATLPKFSPNALAMCNSSSPHAVAVMVVDDEPNIADTLSQILKNQGFKSVVVYSAEEAIAALPDVHPEIVIADVIMGRLSGVDLAVYLAEHFPTCRVLLMSGNNAAAELIDRSAKAGFSFMLLAKPVHPNDILSLMSQ